jgi:hypothetical protein
MHLQPVVKIVLGEGAKRWQSSGYLSTAGLKTSKAV